MVTDKRKTTYILSEYLTGALPSAVILEAERFSSECAGALEEIRLRVGRYTEYRYTGNVRRGDHIPSKDGIDDILFKLCGGSVYAHGETLCKGYIRGQDGIRVGVCGRAVCEGERITAIHGVSSLVIRIPTRLRHIGTALTPYPELSALVSNGLLICSPPGVGKTTALRYTARALSSNGMRVAVIDSRGELSYGLSSPELSIDILDGYPRGIGIEIAIRVICPDVIICDEIGSSEDCRALLSAAGAGVNVIASAHGGSAEDIMSREGIAQLCRSGIFKHLVFLSRQGMGRCDCRIEEVKGIDL